MEDDRICGGGGFLGGREVGFFVLYGDGFEKE